jgi:signal transduction histidine kinase
LTSGIEMKIDLEAVNLDPWTQLAVYRLVQECLTNVGKYAGATKAQIALENRQRDVMVLVLDNGMGFDVEQVSDTRHGLRGIQHRVEACGGRLSVTSSPGHGTRVEAMLPGGFAGAEGKTTFEFDTTRALNDSCQRPAVMQ